MGAANLHAGKAIERSIENHSREEECRFKWVADDISEIPESALFDDIGRSLRVHKNQDTKFLNLGPERVVFWGGWHLPSRMPGDSDAAQSQFPHGLVQLIRCHVGLLQDARCEACKTLRMRFAPG